MVKPPAACTSMSDIRAEIDRIDADLMRLFHERWGYITRAAEIKKPAGIAADIPARVEEVRRHIRADAERLGLDPCFYDGIWAGLIRHSIEHERRLLGETMP